MNTTKSTLYFLTLLNMHSCVFVLVHPTMDLLDLDGTIGAVLEAFDEGMEVESYRVHLDHHGVRQMAQQYKIHPANVHALAKNMHDWTHREGGVDRDGLYYLSTCNPDGYFDWYEVGGRFDGYIPGSVNNTILASTLASSAALRRCLPYYLLTPEGDWLGYERFYINSDWKKAKTDKLTMKEWLRIVRDTLNRWPDHNVVCVDIHS